MYNITEWIENKIKGI